MKFILILLLSGTIFLSAQEKFIKGSFVNMPKRACQHITKMIWDDTEKKCYIKKYIHNETSTSNLAYKDPMKDRLKKMFEELDKKKKKKEQQRKLEYKEHLRKQALLKQKRLKALEKKRKVRNLKLKTFNVYAGIKMYSYIKENKQLDYAGHFKLFGLNGEVQTNNQNEIIKITLKGKVTEDKAQKIKNSLLNKYNKISERKHTEYQSYDKLNTKAYKLYQMGIVSGRFYQIYAQNLTDKSSKIEKIIFKHHKDQIIFIKSKVNFRHKVKTLIKIEYLSKKILDIENEQKRLQEKQHKKINAELNDL